MAGRYQPHSDDVSVTAAVKAPPNRVRPLIVTERTLRTVDAVCPTNMVFALTFSGRAPSQASLTAALSRMQAKTPMFRTRVCEDTEGEPWLVDDPRPIACTVNEGALQQQDLADCINRRMPLHDAPSVRLDVWAEQNRWAAAFTIHHFQSDGTSSLAALQHFLDGLEDPDPLSFTPVTERDLASSSDLAKPLGPVRIAKWLFRNVAEILALLFLKKPRQLPFKEDRTPRQALSELLLIEPARLSSLREQARRFGVSTHSLLCAVQLIALRAHWPEPGKLPLSAYSPTSLRRVLSHADGQPVGDTHMGQLVGYLACTEQVASDSDPLKLAKGIQAGIQRKLKSGDDLDIHQLSIAIARRLERKNPAAAQDPWDVERQASKASIHTTAVSSLGEVKLRHQRLERVQITAGTGPLSPVNGITTIYKGTLCWTLIATAPHADASTLRALRRRIAELVDNLTAPVAPA